MDPAHHRAVITIDRVHTPDLSARVLPALHALWADAYREDMRRYAEDIGPGVHVLAWHGRALVSHAMWVERTLYPAGLEPLTCAYVELVATRTAERGKGFATAVMQRVATEIQSFALGALSPAVPPFYARLGWEMWRGPLSVRTADGVQPTPGEFVMMLRTGATPSGLDLDSAIAVDWRRGEVW